MREELSRTGPTPEARIAYVLKAYPRSSEPFILSEIHRLEMRGLALRLFATKPAEASDRLPRHPMVDRIQATPEFLTPTGSISRAPFGPWLRVHLPRFRRPLTRAALRHPLGLLRGLARLGQELVRSRRATPHGGYKRTYVREFLHAVELVERLGATPAIRHLHAHYAHGATTVAWFASIIGGYTFSFTGHAKDLYSDTSNPGGALQRKLEAARFTVTCTAANQRLLKTLAPAAPVHCVYHGLNTDFSDLLVHRHPPPRPRGRFRVLGVGRLVNKKGFDLLIEAVARLADEGLDIELTIIGNEGEHAPALREAIRRRGVGHIVSIVGPQDQRTLFDAYHEAHVFCLPCRVAADGDRDGIPNVLMEAMACGTPVVTTDVSGIPEMVQDGLNGLVVPPDDPGALASALRRASHDPALLSRLGEAARRTARERFDGDRLASELESLLREAVA